MNWKVWYKDGSTFSNCDGKPEEAPGGGVLAIVQSSSATGREVMHGKELYVYDKESFGGWRALDQLGFAQYIFPPGFKVIKLGEYVSNEAYSQLIRRLKAGER